MSAAPQPVPRSRVHAVLDDGSPMAARILAHDWAATPLGEIGSWSTALLSAVSIMLRTRQPAYIAWGEERTFLFNAEHEPMLGEGHAAGLGLPGAHLWGQRWGQIGPLIDRAFAGTSQLCEDVPLQCEGPGGTTRWFSYSCSPLVDDDGRIQGILSIGHETTARLLAEPSLAAETSRQLRNALASLSASEDRYRRIVEGTLDFAIITLDAHGTITSWNTGAQRMMGYAEAEIVGRPGALFFTPEDRAKGDPEQELENARKHGRAVNERWHLRRDGSRFWGSGLMMRLDAEGTTLLKIFRDRTAEHAIEAQLREREEQLRLATDAAGLALWDLDTTNDTLYWQPRLNAMFGLAPEATVSMEDFYRGLHPDDHECVATALALAMDGDARAPFDEEYRVVGRDGVERWVAAKGRAVFNERGECVRVIGTALDITDRVRTQASLRDLNEHLERRVEEQTGERMKAEEALRQSQKMEAVGQLTGGLAHDFNNMLGTVVGSLDMILHQTEDAVRVQHHAQAGLRAAERGARLTAQLLAFSRAQQMEQREVAVEPLLQGMRDMLAHALGPLVRLSLEPGPDDVQVTADPTQLEMAVLNLAINARDAMPTGGAARIRTRLDEVRDDQELQDGPYVVIEVGDTGHGMPPEVAKRVFEPFFTTKDIGKGTGLGLSQVYAMARQAGGTVRIDSQPGAGTSVHVYLPRTDASVAEPATEAVATLAPVLPATILVVDDDEGLRGVVAEALDALGYRVLQAEDGPAGLALIDSDAPDLVLLDFAMPGMNGAEVARAALASRPDLPIVFATGYAETAAITEVAGADALVLRKPFRVMDLRCMLDRAFARAG